MVDPPGRLGGKSPNTLGKLQELITGDGAIRDSCLRPKASCKKTRMYSWTSLRVGLEADIQLPQAVDTPRTPLVPQDLAPHQIA